MKGSKLFFLLVLVALAAMIVSGCECGHDSDDDDDDDAKMVDDDDDDTVGDDDDAVDDDDNFAPIDDDDTTDDDFEYNLAVVYTLDKSVDYEEDSNVVQVDFITVNFTDLTVSKTGSTGCNGNESAIPPGEPFIESPDGKTVTWTMDDITTTFVAYVYWDAEFRFQLAYEFHNATDEVVEVPREEWGNPCGGWYSISIEYLVLM